MLEEAGFYAVGLVYMFLRENGRPRSHPAYQRQDQLRQARDGQAELTATSGVDGAHRVATQADAP